MTTVKELIEKLQAFPSDRQIFLASDEELNHVFYGLSIDYFQPKEDAPMSIIIAPITSDEEESF